MLQISLNCLLNKLNSSKQNLFTNNIDANELLESFPSELSDFVYNPLLSLEDYIKEGRLDDDDEKCIRKLELYVEWFKIGINDIIAIWFFSLKRKCLVNRVVKTVCVDSEVYPIVAMHNFVVDNMEFLSKYGYLDADLKEIMIASQTNIIKESIIRLSEEMYLRLCPETNNIFSTFVWKNKKINVDRVLGNELCCSIHDIESLSKSWEFYIRKAMMGKGNAPVYVVYKDTNEFLLSLFCVDYKKIIESENAVLCLKKNIGGMKKINGYKARTDLSILLKENVKIFRIHSGLGDQIRYYVLARYVQDRTGATILYDDLFLQNQDVFNGLELDKVVNESKEELRKKLLSNIISKQLQSVYHGTPILPDMMKANGYDGMVSVIANNRIDLGRGKFRANCLSVGLEYNDILLVLDNKYKYYYILTSPEKMLDNLDDFRRYVSLPEINDDKNRGVAREMLSCDAVAIHVRCGDMFMSRSQAVRTSFFRECLKELIKIKEYGNKKYFIFADDINWVKKHKNELGINYLNEGEVFYVDHNKNENSFWDMKLISLAKIIIGSYSGFSRMGALFGSRKEIYVCQHDVVNNDLKRMGWKNKYDIHIRHFGYKFLGNVNTNIDKYVILENENNIIMKVKETNYNFRKYMLKKEDGIYSIHLSGITSDVDEFTLGLYDFAHNRIIQYDTYEVAGDAWFSFSVEKNVDGVGFCFYAGIFGDTCGHNMHVDNFTVYFRRNDESK